ncbi:MAG: hypothetical protein QOG19_1349 [Mycobacterium sp.]|nr:hypothetical protein [Mycobacterium sp.]
MLEVAAWTFVPSAGAVLAEWGTEVIKVEPREGGDPLPVNPVQFDQHQVVSPGAPEHGQHTGEILTDAGMDWDDIVRLKESGAVL